MRSIMVGTLALAGLFVATAPVMAYGRGGYSRAAAATGPRGGAVAAQSSGHAAAGPYGGVHAGATQSRTAVTPGGATVQAGRTAGVSSGPLGGTKAGGASGVKVTTPSGQTYHHANAGGVAVGPAGGVRAGGASRTAVGGPYGGAAVGARGGVAVGPGGAYAGGSRVAVGHTTNYYSPNYMHTWGGGVRTNYHYSTFSPTWYRAHTTAWVAPRWVVPSVWAVPVWASVAVFCSIASPPVVYDYGGTTVINNNTVYVNGTSVGTAEEYATQASSFAEVGRTAKPAENEEWQPLGVFGLVQGEETTAQRIFQLAVNKSGVIRGNYYDAVADNTLPVFGSVDKKSQRAAWSVGEKKDIVFECGLNNLTQNETGVLVHYGKDRTDQMFLIRLEEPKEAPK